MKKLIYKLQSIDHESLSLICESQRRIVLLTGLSSYKQSNLSKIQADFLQAIAPHNFDVINSNFPYHQSMLSASSLEAPLMLASIRNLTQYFAAILFPSYGKIMSQSLQVLLDRTKMHLVIVTGSCGLALWQRAIPFLKFPENLSIHIFALGPVGLPMRKSININIIRGKYDWISRFLSPGENDKIVSCDHLSYYADRSVREWIRNYCENKLP